MVPRRASRPARHQEDQRRLHRTRRQPQSRKPRQTRLPTLPQSHRKTHHLPTPRRPALRRPHAVLADGTTNRLHLDRLRTHEATRLHRRGEPTPLLAHHRQGESDLTSQNGHWYLLATIDIPERPTQAPQGFIGIDLGITNIATASTGHRHSGRRLNRSRQNDRRNRDNLAKKQTRSAKRRARRRAGKEARRTRDINHKISKHIVTEAQRTGRGIALENLGGIRERARLKKPQRVTIHSWAFAQLGAFIAYKARRAGVPVVHVHPAYTSQECSRCHHIDKRNRPAQAVFSCRNCGFVEHADLNASHVIAGRGWWTWVCGAESQVPALTLIA
ncbi:RNA-guided endonuclease InsQ/TnpB family protein [Streptomyces sp. NPDC056373]|uniref:RNA-guided endonuclease InsQ/TnpB family protein n=1 Tax=Streptomyces sp. NPDC056373 TaxID=3345798 RepID=UPI0035D5FC35